MHLWVVAAVVILDQLVKAAVRPRLGLFDSVTVIPGFFSLTRVHNTGAAFGLMNSTPFIGPEVERTRRAALLRASTLAALNHTVGDGRG